MVVRGCLGDSLYLSAFGSTLVLLDYIARSEASRVWLRVDCSGSESKIGGFVGLVDASD